VYGDGAKSARIRGDGRVARYHFGYRAGSSPEVGRCSVETANWFPKIYRQDYAIGLNLTGVGADDPDAQFYENYACGSQRNYTGYCNPELQKMFEQQSKETDQEKRKRLVWEIDRRLQEDQARPIVYHLRFATCWQPRVKGLRMMVNSVFNGWRFEDVWLD
jgi:peptide/nickel transport system substrate-binding protein